MKISKKALSVSPSITLSITAKAKSMRAAGIDVIPLSAGEPDFDTPEIIKKAAKEAIDLGKTKYTPADGIPELKEAIVQKLREDNGLDYDHDQIVVSCGAKHSLFNILFALLDSGDEVLIPAPYWVSYPEMTKLAGGTPKIIKGFFTESGIDIDKIESAITEKTRAIILNSPSNPSGYVFTKNELLSLSQLLKNYPEIVIISDDIYEVLNFSGPFYNILMVDNELYDRVVVVNGVSKAFSMTGWRIGYAAGPKELIKAIKSVQSHSTSNPTSVSQWAAVCALENRGSLIQEYRETFRKRRDYMFERLKEIDGISVKLPGGSFYIYPDVKDILKKHSYKDTVELCSVLLEEAHIAAVPGEAFGTEGYIRLSFTVDLDVIDKAIERIKRVF